MTAICEAIIGNFTDADNFRDSLHRRTTNTPHSSKFEYAQRISYDSNGGHARKALQECDGEGTVE